MKRFDTGFMGSIIKAWIKLARAEKSFLSKRIYSIVRNIAAKRVSTNTTVEKAVLNINWSKKIQQLSKKVINLGMTGWQEKEFVNQHLVQLKKVKDVVYKQSLLAKILRVVKISSGRESLLGMGHCIHGYIGFSVRQKNVSGVKIQAGESNGRIKVEIINEKLKTGFNFVKNVTTNTIKTRGVVRLNYGN